MVCYIVTAGTCCLYTVQWESHFFVQVLSKLINATNGFIPILFGFTL